MKNPATAIFIVTFYLMIYIIAPYFGVDDNVVLIMFFFSLFLIIYMVYVILKYGKPSNHTFDERFYDDWDYIRNGKEEADLPR